MKEELKKRIQALHSGLIPEGYVNTPIGPLPANWRYARLGDIAEPLTETAGKDTYETLSISVGIGFVNQAEKFGKELSGNQYEKYIVLHKGDFSYNKGNSNRYPQGCIYRLNDREAAAVPNVFESFRIVEGCPDYYEQLFISGFLNHQLFRLINHGVRDDGLLNLTARDFYSCLLPVPPVDEQHKIVAILKGCDNMIELYKAKAMQYQDIKKACLDLLFPQSGSAFPKLRFPDYTAAWEQRKFSELVTIERGGSPRPIDKFITKDENGLNWVKIGDAPEQGNYITRTAEKIKPEGRSKTREVHPGDLILSNSMSFGKPYIMAIDGCIHDGWLAIRDTQRNFDLTFLCILLGTDNMLSQYKSMAAGSTVNNLNKELVGGTSVSYPSMDEQIKLGKYFEGIDNLITLHQRASNEYQSLKEALMQLLQTGIVRVEV